MKNSHIALVLLFILCTAANFAGLTGRHNALCLDNTSVRLVWCHPYPPHVFPELDNTTFGSEFFIIIFTGLAWFRVAKKPA